MRHQRVRIDVKFPPQGVTWDEVRRAVLQLDQTVDIEGLWFFDHLASVATGPNGSDSPMPIFDGWTLISSVASITSRLRLGLMVASVLYRPLGVLANTVSTVDVISGGRLDLGLGAGNNAAESRAFGIDFAVPRLRIQQLDEYANCLQLLWSSRDPVSYQGKTVSLINARLELKPFHGRVPLWIGGKGEKRTFPVVARHADYWNFSNGTFEEFSQKLRVLSAVASDLDLSVPIPSVQIQIRPDSTSVIEAATEFFVHGARHFVLYVVPEPSLIAQTIEIANHLRRTLIVS